MKRVVLTALWLAAPPLISPVISPIFAQEPNATQIFARDCASCHAPTDNARAPSLQMMNGLTPRGVVTALTAGRMAQQGATLSEAERIAVAEFITGRRYDASPLPAAALCESASALGDAMTQPGWNGWGNGAANTRFQTADRAGIAAADLPRLTLAWAFGFPDALGARAQPTVIGDWLFTAGDDGTVYALDAHSGCTRWTFEAQAAVRTAVSIAQSADGAYVALFGDGQARAYAVDATNGALLWVTRLDEHENAGITAAPAVHEGRVYFATSGSGEEVRGVNPDYACCTFRGSVSALDIATGSVLWKSHAIAEAPAPRGTSENGVTLYGPAGAGIWGAPTVDAKRRLLYVGTGNGFAGPAQPQTTAIIAMDLATGAQRWVQQTTPGDIWLYQCDKGSATNPNCPDTNGPDFDFGTAPLLTTTPSGRELLVVPQKSGVLYALDPDANGAVVWEHRLGKGSAFGAQWGAASDGVKAYSGVSDTLQAIQGGMQAVDLDSGTLVWSAPPEDKLCDGGAEVRCFAAQGGAVTVIPGVLFSGGSDGGLRAYSSENGTLLWSYDTNRYFDTVNGIIAKGATMDASGPVIVGGWLFVNSGFNGIVGRAGNVLLAFKVE